MCLRSRGIHLLFRYFVSEQCAYLLSYCVSKSTFGNGVPQGYQRKGGSSSFVQIQPTGHSRLVSEIMNMEVLANICDY